MPTIFDIIREKKKPQEDQQLQVEDTISEEKKPKTVIQNVLEKSNQPQEKIETPIKEQKFISDEELEKEIERNQARSTSRALETIAGVPGDIESFARWLGGYQRKEPFLPTSKSLQETSEKLTRGYTKPQNEKEEIADQFVKDFSSYAMSGTATGNVFKEVATKIGVPLAGIMAKQGIKEYGGTEKQAEYGKMGTFFLLDLLQRRISQGGAKEYASKLFNESESLVPQGAMQNSQNLVQDLTKTLNILEKGGAVPETSAAIIKVKELLKKAQSGLVEVDELLATRKRLNSLIEAKGGFEVRPHYSIEEKAVNNLNQVKKDVIKAIDEYANINPQFSKLNKAANEAYSAYSASNVVSNFLKKNFEGLIKSNGLKTILGLGGAGGLSTAAYYAPMATSIGTASIPLYKAFQIGYRAWKSPDLRKHYTDVIKSSLKGNVQQASNSIHILDKKILEEEKAQEKRIQELKSNVKRSNKKKS